MNHAKELRTMTRPLSNIETDVAAAKANLADAHTSVAAAASTLRELRNELEEARAPADYLLIGSTGTVYYVFDARRTDEGIAGDYIRLRTPGGLPTRVRQTGGVFFIDVPDRYPVVHRIAR